MRTLRTWMAVPLGVLALVLVPGRPGRAADVPVAGDKVKMKDATQPGVAQRKVIFVSYDTAIVIPSEGGSADPSLTGGALEIHNGAGSGESVTIPLPAENWLRVPRSVEKPLRGWKYKEVVKDLPTSNYKLKVVFKQRLSGPLLRALAKDSRGNVVGYTLDEPTQGAVAIEVVTGDLRHCALFGGLVRSDESDDLGGDVFRGVFTASDADAPAGCIASPSGAFVR